MLKLLRVYPYRSKWVVNDSGLTFPRSFVRAIEDLVEAEGRRIGRHLLDNHIVAIVEETDAFGCYGRWAVELHDGVCWMAKAIGDEDSYLRDGDCPSPPIDIA